MAASQPKRIVWDIQPGDVFGRLTVLSEAGRSKTKNRRKWNCACECGSQAVVNDSCLKKGFTKSCGCLRREITSKNRSKHKLHGTPEYRSWQSMKVRCLTATSPQFQEYGARGIKVCDRWLHSFTAFLADMGPRPSLAYSIERKDNNGNYEPGNCRWATRSEQMRNTRGNFLLTLNGRTATLAEWAAETGMRRVTIRSRIVDYGWSVEHALTIPVGGLRQVPGS